MPVRVDQPGRHDLAGRVDHFGARGAEPAADRDDLAVADVHVTAGDVARGVHRDDIAAAHQDFAGGHRIFPCHVRELNELV
jgi:hypothetical protein